MKNKSIEELLDRIIALQNFICMSNKESKKMWHRDERDKIKLQILDNWKQIILNNLQFTNRK